MSKSEGQIYARTCAEEGKWTFCVNDVEVGKEEDHRESSRML